MSFLPPSTPLEEQLATASTEAKEDNWQSFLHGLLCRLDLPPEAEWPLRQVKNCDDFCNLCAEQAAFFRKERASWPHPA